MASSSAHAPDYPLPSSQFYAIEYPGYVRRQSVPLAVQSLGGFSCLDAAFRRNPSKTETLLELNLRPGNSFAHPVPGDVVPTNNILVKVVKRKRRRSDGDTGDVLGEYTAVAVGIISKTVRFRSMVDYQFTPDLNDPVAKLRLAMDNMDVDAIRQYSIPAETEDYMVTAFPTDIDPELAGEGMNNSPSMKSNLRLFPPPIFTRQGIPQNYNFKANTASMVSITVDEKTGEEKKRLINRGRWKGYGPASITFSDQVVPDKPPQNVEEARHTVDAGLLQRLHDLFLERMIWTRASLFNQFTPPESRDIHNSKILLPLVCYVFQDGPWRDTLIKFGYDPRKDVNARFFQRLYFRNANHPIARPSVVTRRQERYATGLQDKEPAEKRQSHIFDGITITKETAAFQLCDIHDPLLKEMIENEDDLRDFCNERDGWFSNHALEKIKNVLRFKFFSLLEGYIPTPEECLALLEPQEGTSKLPAARKLRAGKHNMAKGALRPEDAAAVRLRAKLESNARSLQQQRKPDGTTG